MNYEGIDVYWKGGEWGTYSNNSHDATSWAGDALVLKCADVAWCTGDNSVVDEVCLS